MTQDNSPTIEVSRESGVEPETVESAQLSKYPTPSCPSAMLRFTLSLEVHADKRFAFVVSEEDVLEYSSFGRPPVTHLIATEVPEKSTLQFVTSIEDSIDYHFPPGTKFSVNGSLNFKEYYQFHVQPSVTLRGEVPTFQFEDHHKPRVSLALLGPSYTCDIVIHEDEYEELISDVKTKNLKAIELWAEVKLPSEVRGKMCWISKDFTLTKVFGK